MHDYGAGASLEIARADAPALLVPFTRAAVPVVDVAAGRITVVPPAEIEAERAGGGGGMNAPWRASVLTLFPEMFPGPLGHSLAGRALAAGLWSLDAVNIRDFATDRHRSVDDTPFGGGAGMVLRADVVDAAIDAVADDRPLLCLVAARPAAGAGRGARAGRRSRVPC